LVLLVAQGQLGWLLLVVDTVQLWACQAAPCLNNLVEARLDAKRRGAAAPIRRVPLLLLKSLLKPLSLPLPLRCRVREEGR
jgi:hypothetical protein